MFDSYSQTRDHARRVAYLHPATMKTWQDAVRQNRDIDVDFPSGSFLSQVLLRSMKRIAMPILGLSAIIVLVLWACTPSPTQPIPDTPVPTSTGANMPNPASAHCEQQGYRLEIRTAADGSQSGVCIFPDGSECDEWAFFRGECGPAASSPSDSASPMPIDPADYQGWWTYTHKEHGFSIMLPEDWVVEEITTFDPQMNGHTLTLRPKHIAPDSAAGKQSIRMTFRRVGEDARLWPTGVGQGQFVQEGTLEIAGEPARRLFLACPGGDITSIWYHSAEEDQPNILRGDLEFGFIFSATPLHCEPGHSLGGKIQRLGEMIIASLKVP